MLLFEDSDETLIVETIKEELSNATEGDYDFTDYNDKEVALDLMAYSPVFEEWNDADKLATFVAKARAS